MSEVKHPHTPKRTKKAAWRGEELELFELAQLAGVTMDPQIFHILLELLRLDISPFALADILQDMSAQVSKLKKYSDNKNSTHIVVKKKPPVAAKPKKIKNTFWENKPSSKNV